MLHEEGLSGAFEPPDRATDGVLTLDTAWHITGLNEHVRQKTGFGDECIGRDLWHMFPLSAATHARGILENALEKGEETRFRFYGPELGSWVDVRVRPGPSGIELAFRDLAEDASEGVSHRELSAPALNRIAEEMRRMADRISHGTVLDSSLNASAGSWSDGQLARVAEAIYRERRRRGTLLPLESTEPQWDILLDLFIQALRNNRVSVTSACIAADVPASTALRALDQLTAAGMVARQEDLQDKRRVWVALTKQGMDAMRRFLRHAAAAARDIGS